MGSEKAKVFSLQNSICLLAGILLPGGVGDSDWIEIEKKSDSWNSTEGVDGSAAFAQTNSKLYTLKLKYLQTATANAVLTGIYEAQQVSRILVPFAWKDTGGADLFIAESCVIMKPPKINRGNKIVTQEWALECADGRLFLGGN